MKKMSFLLLSFCLLAMGLHAQTFQHNIEESLTLGKAEQKKVLLIFSGSDWCKSCIQLKKDILTSNEFVQYSDDNLVLLELDFPYRKQNKLPKAQQTHNENLAEEFNPKGIFPRVVVLDENKQVLGQVRYKKHMTADDFIRELNKISM